MHGCKVRILLTILLYDNNLYLISINFINLKHMHLLEEFNIETIKDD